MPDPSNLMHRINSVVCRVCKASAAIDQDLIKSGICDSLRFMNLLIEIESEFGIELFVEGFDATDYLTVQDIHRQVRKHMDT